MKISSNYNLSFNQKVNNQQSKTNPNFGINTKNLMFPLGAGAIGAAAHKLMPVPPAGIFLTMYSKFVSENNDSGLADLPADENGYTYLHYLCKDGSLETVKKFLTEHPNINLSQMTKNGDTCMSLAVKNKYNDIINLIANRDNYNPVIPDKNGMTDLHNLCEKGYTDVVKFLLEKHPEIDINQQTKKGSTCMSLAIGNLQKNTINLIANMDKYAPTIPDKDGWTDLHRLCNNGYTDVIKTLLEKHPEIDFNQKSKYGYTCMSIAIDLNHIDIINLIANTDKYNPVIPDEDGLTDLHRLCKNGYADVVKTLLEKHPEIDINLQTEDGDTCMSLAIKNTNNDIMNLIANRDNYNPVIPDKDGWTDLHRLFKHGYTDLIKTLLEKHPEIDINQQTEDGDTYMHIAGMRKLDDIVNLIANMDNYNPAVSDCFGTTDLHYLCEEGYTDAVKTLLEKHPEFDINQKNIYGETCMALAIDYKQKDIIDLIANTNNYKPNIPDKNGWTDLHRLCSNGYTDVVKTLLEKHPEFDINQQTENGNTCMSLAIENKREDTINLIAGMDKYNPTIPDKDGWTDLHRLCKFGYTDIVKTLLEKHPEFDINQQTKYGSTCMSLAIRNKREDVINLIAGLDNYKPDIPDKEGRTDLHRLCDSNYTEVIEKILKNKPDLNINQLTGDGYSCMTIAIANLNEDLVNLIAGFKNYNPLIINKFGANDLHYLCSEGYTEAVKTILDNNPNIDLSQLTKDGLSYIDLAKSNNHADTVKIISEKISENSLKKETLNLPENDSAKHNAGKETDKKQVKTGSLAERLMEKAAQILRL